MIAMGPEPDRHAFPIAWHCWAFNNAVISLQMAVKGIMRIGYNASDAHHYLKSSSSYPKAGVGERSDDPPDRRRLVAPQFGRRMTT